MPRPSLRATLTLFALGLGALLLLSFFFPAASQAAAGEGLSLHSAPATGVRIPWLDEIMAELLASLVKVLQDLMKGIGILFWAVLKLCGIVGLLGSDFSSLFGSVVVEAITAVVSGSIGEVIRGSLMVSLGLLGLSLLARAFWPDLRVVSFQRIVLWGTVIQAYLLNAPAVYTGLEAMRVDLAEEVAQAVSSGAVPGCNGSTVEVILCMTGTNAGEVQAPELTALPDSLPPYGGAETVHDLYNHCVYNPPAYYGEPDCDPEAPTGDPWEVLTYAQAALGSQVLSTILALLILAYGILQMALGLAAGMMFVLFPVAAIFAFYIPLESFAAGVVRNYISIFLKSVVLLTLAAVVIRLFTVAAGNLISLSAVGLIALLLCGIMAKEAVASLLSNVSFVGSSVGNLGAAFGLTGAAAGGGAGGQSAESRLAASMLGGPMAQTLLGAPHPYAGAGGGNLLSAAGSALRAPGQGARAAVAAAVSAGTGGAGFLVGTALAARGTDFGSLALGSSAASILGGRDAAQGFTLGASLGAMRRAGRGSVPAAGFQPAVPAGNAPQETRNTTETTPTLLHRPSSNSKVPGTTVPAMTAAPAPAVEAIQAILGNQTPDMSGWTPAAGQQIQTAAASLGSAPVDVRQSAYDLMQASHDAARRWEDQGRSPFLENGILDPQFMDDVIQQAPAAARAFTVGQARAATPPEQQLRLAETIALGTMSPAPPPPTPAPTATPVPTPAAAVTPEGLAYDPALYDQLRTWRQATAQQMGTKAFHVFANTTLQRITAARPQTLEELAAVKGVGSRKLEQFGQGVLDITRAAAGEENPS